jgi:hypothetical protein
VAADRLDPQTAKVAKINLEVRAELSKKVKMMKIAQGDFFRSGASLLALQLLGNRKETPYL